jgi:hypothetical protein
MNIPRRATANAEIFAGPGGTSKSQGQLYSCKILQNYIIQVTKQLEYFPVHCLRDYL